MKARIYLSALLLCLLLKTSCDDSGEYPYRMSYLPVQLEGSAKWSILDVNSGEVVIRDRFDRSPSTVVNGMFYYVNDDGTVDYYDVTSPEHPVNDKPYGSATCFGENGLAIASRRGGPLEIIDKKGNTVVTLPADIIQCRMFMGGRAEYQNEEGLWGYLDERGDTVIPARFANVRPFGNSDYALVVPQQAESDTATFAVINLKGEEQFRLESGYQLIQPKFVQGVLPVIKGDTMVCLDSKGREVPNPTPEHDAVDKAGYDNYAPTADGHFIVIKSGKAGLVDKRDETLIQPRFDRLLNLAPDRYVAVEDSVCHLVDGKGQPVGNARFIHAHGNLDTAGALRGFIDTDLAVATLLTMFDSGQCCGATPATTLMDLNSLLGPNALEHVGSNTIAVPQGPFSVAFAFSDNLASVDPDSVTASFNYSTRVRCVMITLPVVHTGLDTEQQIIDKTAVAMGRRGFVLQSDGVFASDAGTAVSMGYDRGVVRLYYYMNSSYALSLPRNRRK